MRLPRLVVILRGMQVSHIIRALPVLCCLAPDAAAQAAAATRYRVAAETAGFHLEPGGRRLARLVRGAQLTGGATRGDWVQITLDGWIWSASVGASPRPDFDLLVTRAPEENLRAAPGGAVLARLAQGFGLARLGQDQRGRWIHVTRDGWVERAALARAADVADTASTRPAGDSGAAPAAAGRAQPTRMTTLYRAPEGSAAGTIAAETPVRVLGRTGEWARVQFEGWVKAEDLQAAPPGVLVGVTAAELRAEPQRYTGQVLRWRVEFIALQQADDLRPDIPGGATYVLARGPLPERGFVYVIVPEAKLAAVRALAPLVTMHITARVRAGRSRYLGNPVVELLSLETTP